MSTTQPASSSYDCEYGDCSATFPAGHAVEGSFCSTDCYHRHQGQKVLNNLQHDHCYCSNCGAKLKEIEKPPKTFLVGKDRHAANSIVGFQYRTPEAATGEIDVKTDVQGRETVATGTVCGECGNTNQTESFPEDQQAHVLEYGQRILDSLQEKRDQGVPIKQLDDDTFFDILIERGELELAVGKAIE